MSASWKDFQPQGKKENMAPYTTVPAASTPAESSTHSQGVGAFLTRLSGAYDSNDYSAIRGAQNTLVGVLKTEKKIEEKRVEVKKDNEFTELFDKTLGVEDNFKNKSEMETKIKATSDIKAKKVKKDDCCGCGGCDEF